SVRVDGAGGRCEGGRVRADGGSGRAPALGARGALGERGALGALGAPGARAACAAAGLKPAPCSGGTPIPILVAAGLGFATGSRFGALASPEGWAGAASDALDGSGDAGCSALASGAGALAAGCAVAAAGAAAAGCSAALGAVVAPRARSLKSAAARAKAS